MSTSDVGELRKAVELLAEEADFIAAVILFGSLARGEAGGESDIDLFVITRGLEDIPRYRRTLMAYEVLSGLSRAFGRPITIVDMEMGDFLALRSIRPLMLDIIWDGILLLDKTGGLVAERLRRLKEGIRKSGLRRHRVGGCWAWRLPKPLEKVVIEP